MKRREFVNWVGFGVLASSLPMAIAACRPGDTADAPQREDGFSEIGTVADLDAAGVLTHPSVQGMPVAVRRDPANGEALIAVSTFCPHQGCTVEWDGDLYACPCHEAQFTAEGELVQGPAEEGLTGAEARLEGDLVLVRLV